MTLGSIGKKVTRSTVKLEGSDLELVIGEIIQSLQSTLSGLVQEGVQKALVETVGNIRQQTVPVDALWDMQTTAKYLGVKDGTLYVWSSQGTGPAPTKIGKKLMYRPEIVREYAKNRTLPR